MNNLHGIGFSMVLAASLIAACGGDTNNNNNSSGGTAGGGGEGGTLTSDPAGPKNPDDALKAAIILGSCAPDDGVNRILERIYADRRGDAGEIDFVNYTHCVATAANGCKALETCFGITFEVSAMPCNAVCNGDVLTACGDGMKFTADCSKFGLACSAADANCIPKTMGTVCDPAMFMETCKDGAPLICTDVEQKGPNCADYGLSCGTTALGGVGCIGSGPACMVDSTAALSVNYDQGISCNGAKLLACMNGFEQEVDCATLVSGFTCQTSGMKSFCGIAGECDPTAGVAATCEGDNVVVCNGGRIDKVDCKSLGFTGCNAKYGTCSPSIYDQFP